MAGKSLGPKRVLKTHGEKEHSVEKEVINLYEYLHALFEKILGRGKEEDVQKIDDLISVYLKRTKKEISRIIIPIMRWIRNQRTSIKFNRNKNENKKNDKIVLKRR
ncbi:MAG: hypothetical protein ACXVHY_08795 [Methanobacterium sp.]